MKALHMVAFVLTVLGALNWGLVGLFKFNLVTTVLGSFPSVITVVYVLVGLSAVYLIVTHMNDCKVCGSK
jgi:uncharacterized membrane protein YuzA (DUF378 family)